MKLLTTGSAMNFSKKTFAVASLAAAVAIAGCSSDNPDSGSNITKTPIAGTAVDGYIANAIVYVDRNNDGRRGPAEPAALTDKDGNFTTAKDGTDYCADDASEFEAVHCLTAAQVQTGAVIRTVGGFDVFTGEPFTGSLAARVTVGSDGVVENQMVSPLTTMLVDVDEADQQSVLNFFGLSNSDLESDFLDSAGFDANTLNSAIKLHKIVTILSDVFSSSYEAFGEERFFPETPNAIVYKAISDVIIASNQLNSTTLGTAFDAVQGAVLGLYAGNNLIFPGDVSSSERTAAIADALSIIDVVNGAIPSGTIFDDAKKRVIGVDVVVRKLLNGGSGADKSDLIAAASSPTSDFYSEISDALSLGDIDFIELADINYANPDYSNMSVEPGNSFANLANKQLYINLADGTKTGSGYVFFNSETGEPGGALNLCLEYDDGDPNTQKFEETEGVLLEGTWLSLDDSRLILNLAGSLSVSLYDKGEVSANLNRYTLNYGGDTLSWTSSDGVLDELVDSNIAEQPTDDASCEVLLNRNLGPV